MASEELSLPRLPGVSWDEHSQSFSNNPRKRVRNSTSKHAPSPAFNNSSDPAIFSSDDDPALDNYVEGRRKKRYVGSWFQQHPTSSDSTFGGDSRDTITVTKQRRAWSRQADSGVFLPSDGDGNESDDVMDIPEPSKPRLPQLNRVVRRVSKAEQMARDKVQACLDQGEETIDFWSMGLEDISNDTISPLSQFTCIPVVTKDVAFEQKDPELKIYMAMNRLTRVPGTIFDLTHLTILSLRHNKLTELPSAIAKLHNLKELNVSQNRLRHLPVELLDLFSSDNDLRTLVVHPNPFWQPNEQLVRVSENQIDNSLFSYRPESESSQLPHLVSRVLGRSPLQLSNTTGRVISDFKFPTDHTKHILPVDGSESDSSTSSPVSATSKSQHQASRVPSLLETALRACYQSAQLPEMPYYIPDGLTHLRKLLERAQRQKDAGGLTCSRCRKFMVIPTVEWVEWREIRTCKIAGSEAPEVLRMTPLSMAEGERTVPFVYRGCSWRCGPGKMDKASWGLPAGELHSLTAEV